MGSPDHIRFVVADVKPKEVVSSLVHESLVAYQKFQDMFGSVFLRFDLRMLVGSYELVVAGRRHILDQDIVAVGCTYAVSESMDTEVEMEALNLQSKVEPHCTLSQHARAFVAADLRKFA